MSVEEPEFGRESKLLCWTLLKHNHGSSLVIVYEWASIAAYVLSTVSFGFSVML